jgi:hypothetical protein
MRKRRGCSRAAERDTKETPAPVRIYIRPYIYTHMPLQIEYIHIYILHAGILYIYIYILHFCMQYGYAVWITCPHGICGYVFTYGNMILARVYVNIYVYTHTQASSTTCTASARRPTPGRRCRPPAPAPPRAPSWASQRRPTGCSTSSGALTEVM